MRLAAVRGPNGNKKTHENEDICKYVGRRMGKRDATPGRRSESLGGRRG
jgi:hypothetical protein